MTVHNRGARLKPCHVPCPPGALANWSRWNIFWAPELPWWSLHLALTLKAMGPLFSLGFFTCKTELMTSNPEEWCEESLQ